MGRRRRSGPESKECSIIGYCSFCEEDDCLLDNAQPIIEFVHCPDCGLFARSWKLDLGPWTLDDGVDVHAVRALVCGDCDMLWITTERLTEREEDEIEVVVLEVEL